ncbi:MAG TPA: hypothetical protein VK158_01500 [Acidobacteriota bacterium]|nr:hypothetical protein [Acidobacteriota bacterium]
MATIINARRADSDMNVDFRPLLSQMTKARAVHSLFLEKVTGANGGILSLIEKNAKYLAMPGHSSHAPFVARLQQLDLRSSYRKLIDEQNSTGLLVSQKIQEIHSEITRLTKLYNALQSTANEVVRDNHRALGAIDAALAQYEAAVAAFGNNPAHNLDVIKEQATFISKIVTESSASWKRVDPLLNTFNK